MGILQSMAWKSEQKVVVQLNAELLQIAPHFHTRPVVLPCHIVNELHQGVGVVFPDGAFGLFRCQGHFWSAPIPPDALPIVSVGNDAYNPGLAPLYGLLPPEDLGPLSPGGTRSVAAAVALAPELLLPPKTHNQVDEDQELGREETDEKSQENQDQDQDQDDDDDDDYEAEAALWEDEISWLNDQFPQTLEGRLCAELGVEPEIEGLVWEPILVSAGNNGIQLAPRSDQTPGVFLQAETDALTGGWFLRLIIGYDPDVRGTKVTPNSPYLLGARPVCSIETPLNEVASRTTETLRSLATKNTGEERFACLHALAVWGAICKDSDAATDALIELQSSFVGHDVPNNISYCVYPLIRVSPHTTADHLRRLDDAFE